MNRLLLTLATALTFSLAGASTLTAKEASKKFDPKAYIKKKNSRPVTSTTAATAGADAAVHVGAATIDCTKAEAARTDAPAEATGGDATPMEVVPGETVERQSVPAGKDLVQAIVKSARERCKPKLPGVKDEAPPVGKTDVTFGLTRDEETTATENGQQALRPTIGISKRF